MGVDWLDLLSKRKRSQPRHGVDGQRAVRAGQTLITGALHLSGTQVSDVRIKIPEKIAMFEQRKGRVTLVSFCSSSTMHEKT